MAKNELHKIKVYLYPNHLTDNPNDLMARVASDKTLEVREICKTAVTRAKLPTTIEAMEHNVNLFLKEMMYLLKDGYAINTGVFTANVQIRGVFNSLSENFNPEKHEIFFRFNQGELLRKEISNLSVEIVGMGDTDTIISCVEDVKTGSVNDLLTPNRNLKIKGGKLKIIGNHEANGIYFVNQATEERIRVEDSDIVINNPSELFIVVPALPAGSYRLELTTQFSGNTKKILKSPRTTAYHRTLTVQ